MKDDKKYKIPVDIKGDLELPDLELENNYSPSIIKKKISANVEEVGKIKKKKCQSSKLV